MVSVKPLWIYEAIFTLVTTGNMSVYQHVLEKERVPATDSFTHTHTHTHSARIQYVRGYTHTHTGSNTGPCALFSGDSELWRCAESQTLTHKTHRSWSFAELCGKRACVCVHVCICVCVCVCGYRVCCRLTTELVSRVAKPSRGASGSS